MTDYGTYTSSLRLIADEQGERTRQSAAIESDTAALVAAAHSHDRELQGRWSAAARRLRDLSARVRRLGDDAGLAPSAPSPVAPTPQLAVERVEAELSSLERDAVPAESAAGWIVRARAQVHQERARLGGQGNG